MHLNRCAVAFMALVGCIAPVLSGQATVARTLKICVADNAPPEVRESAERIRAGISASPLLSLLATNGVSLNDSGKLYSGPVESRAYHHLILVGLPSDPLIQAAWQHESAVEEGGLYVFGFGHLRGTIGYIESDRNPFLHSAQIAAAPYETEVITITGSSPAGVRLAAEAFLTSGLINGVVAAPGWSRPRTTILDRAPLTLPLGPLALAPATVGDARRIGVTQSAENEYRDVLQDTGTTPVTMWRVKYFEPGAWDPAAPAEASSPAEYLNGLHRRATGNTLWIAQFASSSEAASATVKIAEAAHLQKQKTGWSGPRPSGNYVAEPNTATGEPALPLTLWVSGNTVFLSTVPQITPDALPQSLVR
jgi:hypothetical protein